MSSSQWQEAKPVWRPAVLTSRAPEPADATQRQSGKKKRKNENLKFLIVRNMCSQNVIMDIAKLESRGL